MKRSVNIRLLAVGLMLSVPAYHCAAQIQAAKPVSQILEESARKSAMEAALGVGKPVTDIGAKIQRGAQFSENLEHWFSEMAQWEQMLNTTLESTDWMRKTYSAAQFVGCSTQMMDVLGNMENFKTLLEQCANDINNYGQNGLLSASQLVYSSNLLTQSLNSVAGVSFANLKEALSSNGMSVGERFSTIVGFNDKLKDEYYKLFKLKNDNDRKAAAAQYRIEEINKVSILTGLSPVAALNTGEDYHDSFADQLSASGRSKYNRYYGGGFSVSSVASTGRSFYSKAVDFASILIGIAGALLLVIAFERRNKGEKQSQDALYKIGAGLLFALIALQIVTRYFHF